MLLSMIYLLFAIFSSLSLRHHLSRAVIIGCPPFFRGTTKPGRDLELQILKYFPNVAVFVEKPVATGIRDDVKEAFAVAKAIEDSDTICSVG